MNYRYIGEGRFLVSVPARDLTGEDVARLPDRLRRRLVSSGLYAPVYKAVKAVKEVKPDV